MALIVPLLNLDGISFLALIAENRLASIGHPFTELAVLDNLQSIISRRGVADFPKELGNFMWDYTVRGVTKSGTRSDLSP